MTQNKKHIFKKKKDAWQENADAREGERLFRQPRPAPAGEKGVNFQAPCSSLDSVAWQPHKHLLTIQPCRTNTVLK